MPTYPEMARRSPIDLGGFLGVDDGDPGFDPGRFDLSQAYGEGSPENAEMGAEGFLSRFLGVGDGAQTAGPPAHLRTPGSPMEGGQQGPMGEQAFLQNATDPELRRYAMTEYIRHATEGPPKAKPVKLDWKEAIGIGLASQFNPGMIPVFMRQKMQPHQDALAAYSQRGNLLETMLGLSKPEEPKYAGSPGSGGVYEMPARRGGQPRQVIPPYEAPLKPERPRQPVSVGKGAGLYDPETGTWLRQPSAGGAGGVDDMPAGSITAGLRAGVNVWPKGHRFHEIGEEIAQAIREKPDEQVRSLYARILGDAIERKSGVTGKLKEGALEEAKAEADEILDAVEQRVGGAPGAPPPGAGGPDPALLARIQARGDQLAAQGLNEEQVAARLRQEFPEAFPE